MFVDMPSKAERIEPPALDGVYSFRLTDELNLQHEHHDSNEDLIKQVLGLMAQRKL